MSSGVTAESVDAAATVNEAIDEVASPALTVATVTSLWFGGQRLHAAPGIPLICGALRSMETVIVRGASELPARSVAKYVTVVTPSAVTVMDPPVAQVPD